jgi:hypothetical protein
MSNQTNTEEIIIRQRAVFIDNRGREHRTAEEAQAASIIALCCSMMEDISLDLSVVAVDDRGNEIVYLEDISEFIARNYGNLLPVFQKLQETRVHVE